MECSNNPLAYLDRHPTAWLAGAAAALNILEVIHRERPWASPAHLLEATRHQIQTIPTLHPIPDLPPTWHL